MARLIMLALMCASAFITASCAFAADRRSVAVANANPIRRIVNMLQGLAKKIKEEGDKEAKMLEDYKCYCKKNTEEITAGISNNEAKMPQLQSGLQVSQSKVSQLKAEVKAAQDDQAAAEAAVESATKQRDAENKEYIAESEEYKAFINTLNRAIPAIEKGMSSSFLQANGMQATLQTALESTMQLSEYQKENVVAFLSGKVDAPQSGEIVGMLKTMKDEAETNLADADSTESGQVKTHEELVAAKTKQINALKEPRLEKSVRIGELALATANIKKDLAETSTALRSDQNFAGDLEKSCSEKEATVEKNAAARSDESLAVSDTITILNEDTALETFKKTLPSASLLQMDTSFKRQGTQALRILRSLRSSGKRSEWGKSDVDLLELALKGGKGDFSKVTKMIDDMVAVSNTQQATDDNKLETCKKQTAASEAKLKTLGQKISNLGATADERADVLSSAKAEVKGLTASIQQLDAAVKGATAQRQNENAEFKQVSSANHAAMDLLNLAKTRMSEFYHPSKHPEAGFIVVPGWHASPSFAQISMHTQTLAYQNKKEGGNKVISMLDHLIQGLSKEVTVGETEEKYAQQDYERMMKDSEERRAESARSLVEKGSVMADAEDSILETQRSLKTETAQKADAEKFASQLNSDCSWLMSNYDARTEARASEASALRDTKATLAGADFSFVQTGTLRGASAALQ